LESHARKLQKKLGDNLVGYYLQGSLAIGDFDMTSDVDFIVVTYHDLLQDEVDKIQQIHTATLNQDTRWVTHLEYSFFPLPLLNIHSSPFVNGKQNNTKDTKLWYFDNGSKSIERSDHCNTLVTRWTVREQGITVIGPDPKTIIDPIDPNDLRKEIRETMAGWGREIETRPDYIKNRFYQSYLVLNYARMLQDLYEGRVTSKLEGITWAKSTLDPKWIPLIDFCWRERQDTEISIKQAMDPNVFEESLAFVKYTIDQAAQFEIK